MSFLDLFGPQASPEAIRPDPRPPHTSGVFSVFGDDLPFKRRIAELESECASLRASQNDIFNQNFELANKLAAASAATAAYKNCLDNLKTEITRLRNSNRQLEEELNTLKLNCQRESPVTPEERPVWAKHFHVDDLFADATNSEQKARRFRELSKIYHPDIRNNPAGLGVLIEHLKKKDPNWFQAACHEAYLLIMKKKERS